MESVCIEADGGRLTGALETVLAGRGYRTLRSFDLPLNSAADAVEECRACGERRPGACACRYTVLLAFPSPGGSGMETITVQGKGDNAIITLLTHVGDSGLSPQFASILLDALHASQGNVPDDEQSLAQTNGSLP